METKKCPKCNKDIPASWTFHKDCGWKEKTNQNSSNFNEPKADGSSFEIDSLIERAERIATISSPSNTYELSLDVLDIASKRKLLGELAIFKFEQDSKPHYALGQITGVSLRNVWLEEAQIRSLVRQKGQVNPISGVQDTHKGELKIGAVLCRNGSRFEPSILGTVPPTGTYIHLVNDEILSKLMVMSEDEIFYLGRVYGSSAKLPLWFKHFGTGPGGVGEAYHIGIFGKTGSGKSVLAKMIMVAYARHPNMAIFVIDPQGEFSKDVTQNTTHGQFRLNLRSHLESLNREIIVYGVKDLVLDSWELFIQILARSNFFLRLTVPTEEKRRLAAEVISENLERVGIKLSQLHSFDSFDLAWSLLKQESIAKIIYPSKEQRERLLDVVNRTNSKSQYSEHWLPVCRLFQEDRKNAISIDSLLKRVFSEEALKPIVIINVSQEDARGLFWNDTIQALVIKRLLEGINRQAELNYKENKSLNTLVIIDEARRFAPRKDIENDEIETVRETLVRASKETRKYGLGWMFISQTLSSLHREIIEQLRICFFGFGLALGLEYLALKDMIGEDYNALKLYQSFRDPSVFDEFRQHSFMTIGPVSPLSFQGCPLFFTAFNKPEEFIEANRLL